MRMCVGACTLWLAWVLGFVPTHAQHTLAAKFDLTKPLTLTGTVTQVDWANPYVHVLMKVPGQPLPALWAVELEGPIVLTNNGWSETSLAPGEMIRVEGFAARDGSKQVSGKSVVMTRTGRAGLRRDQRHAASASHGLWTHAPLAGRPPAARSAARADRVLGLSEPHEPGRGRRERPDGRVRPPEQHRRRVARGAAAAMGAGALSAAAARVPPARSDVPGL